MPKPAGLRQGAVRGDNLLAAAMDSDLYLSVRGGLGNRLSALGAALVWAEQAGARLRLGWLVDDSCGAPFDALFEVPEALRLMDQSRARRERQLFGRREPMRGTFDRLARMIGSRWLDEPDLRARRRMVSTDELRRTRRMHVLSQVGFYLHDMQAVRFEAMSGANLRGLVPVPSVRSRLVPLPAGTVGVHIRRGDHLIARAASPPGLFRRRMDELVEREPDVAFFLCSDDVEVERELTDAFGARVITSGKAAVDRGSIEGVRDAAADLLMLSQCRRVLHSVMSSFGRVAARIGSVPDDWVGDPVTAVQGRLMELGLYPGPVDGTRSASFEAAWREFQRRNGLEPGTELTFYRMWHLFGGRQQPLRLPSGGR